MSNIGEREDSLPDLRRASINSTRPGSIISVPPRYSTLSLNSIATLPVYPDPAEFDISAAAQDSVRRQHEYFITSSSRGRPWATLNLLSSAAITSQRPRYVDAGFVEGSISLDLDRPQTVNSISISLRGRMITSSLDEGSQIFLEHVVPIWSKDAGDPRETAPTKKFDGKLHGNYNWPFSFPFPTEFRPPQRGGQVSQSFSTPQTFLERGVDANIQYDLLLRISTGILRTKHKILINVIFVPVILTPPASELRQKAYREGQFLPGPLDDPEGWISQPPVVIRGVISSSRKPVEVECILSLASPLSYTRGTVIPCFIALKSGMNLDEFVDSQSFTVNLTRRVTFFRDPQQALSGNMAYMTNTGRASHKEVDRSTVMGEAVWWPPLNGRKRDGHSRTLEGEIHLDNDLQPSCELPFIVVTYSIDLYASKSSDFEPMPTKGIMAALVSLPVTITTVHREGPIPIAFTPRSNKKPLKREEFDEVVYLIPVNAYT